MELTEAQIKKAVEEQLKELMGYGKLYYERMNVGVFGPHHNIQGAKKGTADFLVVQAGQVHLEYMKEQRGPAIRVSFVTWIECKTAIGKQNKDQLEFQERVENLHCRYAIVRNVEELKEVLDRD